MTEEKFDLSEKERVQFIEGIGLNLHYYKSSDVKEFIRRLRKELCFNIYEGSNPPLNCNCCSCKEIDALAGDKLK
jgi:hypothetical protein